MKNFWSKKYIDVYIKFDEKVVYFKLHQDKGRFKIENKENLEEVYPAGKNVTNITYYVKHIDTMDIKKIEIPKNISGKLLKSLVEKEAGEEGSKYIIKFWAVETRDAFKIINIFKREKTEFFQISNDTNFIKNISMFTYVPFAMLYYNQEVGNGKILHIHLYEDNLFLLFSVNGYPEFFRFTKLDRPDEIYENIILTYRYILTSIDTVDLVLLSFDTNQIDYENLYQTLNKELAVINPYFYVERDKESSSSPDYDFILPVGAVLLENDYNFIPEEVVQDRNLNFLLKFFSTVLVILSLAGFTRLLFISSSMVDEFLEIQAKASEVNLKIKNLVETLEDKDIETLNLKNKLSIENYNQNKAINSLLKYQDLLKEDNLKITLTKTEKGFQVSLNLKKKFSSFQEMERFCDKYSKIASISKNYNDKSVEVVLSYDITQK